MSKAVENSALEAWRRELERDLWTMEVHRHRTMEAMLDLVLQEVPLSPALAREVCAELEVRRRLIAEADRGRRAASSMAWYHRSRAERTGAKITFRSAAAPACVAATEPDRT